LHCERRTRRGSTRWAATCRSASSTTTWHGRSHRRARPTARASTRSTSAPHGATPTRRVAGHSRSCHEEFGMTIRILRLGTPRKAGEGIRLGTVRRPPRGVPKSEFASRDFYDVWLPALSPSQELVTFALNAKDERSWKTFVRKFRTEMHDPEVSRLLDLLAAMSHQTNF